MNYDDLDTVLVTREGHIGIVSLNRPEARNAMNSELSGQFHEALRRVARDESMRAILIRGEGKSFCVGGDVKDFDEQSGESTESSTLRVTKLLHGTEVIELLLAIPQPTVSAVQGHAMGLGSTIAMFCDVMIVADDAKIADTHVNIGLVAGDGGAVTFPLMMPFGSAKWYLMTGDRMSGTEAEKLGVALRSVPESELHEASLEIASRLASMPPLAVQGTKATLNRILRNRMDQTLQFGLLYEGATFLSEDHKEAASAFVQRREPTFHGR
ncbi:MAG: enoyl-CoA hydratase/isomerase family protein [Actinomycetota bacterium]|nr:enoyl-CoA hydratase/isomerase family protein [Actinomycetota bacterium]